MEFCYGIKKQRINHYRGASGLGEATVRAFAAQGGKVAIFDLDEERGNALAKELGDAIFQKVDVTDEANVKAAVEATVAALGGLNNIVNCAGVGFAAKVLGKKGIMTADFWDKVISINLTGHHERHPHFLGTYRQDDAQCRRRARRGHQHRQRGRL